MRRRVALQLVGDADLQVSPFADQLAQLISLLPALHAVIANLLGLDPPGLGVWLIRPRIDRVGQTVENGGNVIVELRARE